MDSQKFTLDGEVGLSQKAFIFKEDKLLAIRRTETAPHNALKWEIPGGILEFGEEPYDAIKRETQEETGLIIDNIHPFEVITRIHRENEFWLTIVYKADVIGGDLKLSWEHDLYKWVTVDEFLEMDASPDTLRFGKMLKKLI